MTEKFANFAVGTLAQSAAIADTVIYLDSVGVALLPTLTPPDFTRIVLYDNAQAPEICFITAVSGQACTVTRARESTSAKAWIAGTRWRLSPTAESFARVANLVTTTVLNASAVAASVGDYTATIAETPTVQDGVQVDFTPGANPGGLPIRFRLTDGTTTTSYAAIYRHDGTALGLYDLVSEVPAQVRYSSALSGWYLVTQPGTQLYATGVNEGPVGGVRQLARNGRFEQWTAATSFSSPVTGTETADGWTVYHDGTIGTYSVSRQAFTAGQTDVPNEPRFFLRWDHTVAGSGSTVRKLRNLGPGGVRRSAGKYVTRSIWLKADSARNVTINLGQYFGSGGGPSADVQISTAVAALTTSWQRFTLAGLAPSVAGKTFGSGLDEALYLDLILPLNVTMTIDAAEYMANLGQLAENMEPVVDARLLSYGTSGPVPGLLNTNNTTSGNNTHSGTETFSGLTDIAAELRLSGDTSPAQITSNQNDYTPSPGNSVIRINSDAYRIITGIAAGADGRIYIIHNTGLYTIALSSENTGSAAANRFSLGIPTGSNFYIGAGRSCAIYYDSTTARWRLWASTAIGYSRRSRVAYVASNTYTTPVGCRALKVKGVAGGGGGGAALNDGYKGGGGGGGGYGEVFIEFPAASYTVTIGAAGVGGTVVPAAATGGGTTSFGTALVLSGGAAGNNNGGAFAAAGTASAADQFFPGQVGGYGGLDTTHMTHDGGNSTMGAGGRGSAAGGGGNSGSGYGSGGGGGYRDTVTSRAGGAGAPGFIEIEEFF